MHSVAKIRGNVNCQTSKSAKPDSLLPGFHRRNGEIGGRTFAPPPNFALYLPPHRPRVPSGVLLQWFITEQGKEEKNAAEIVQQLELIDARGTAVLMLDHQLGKRGKE